MLIIALVLAVIGLAALVTAVVTSNELIAWVCIGASVIGVLLLIVDALRERSRGAGDEDSEESDEPDERRRDHGVRPARARRGLSRRSTSRRSPRTPRTRAAVEADEHDDDTSRSKAD